MVASIVKKVYVWLDMVIVWPVLLWRYCQFGYAFRRIYLGEGIWTILEQPDYYRLRKYKWVVYAGGNGGENLYAVRLKLIEPYRTTIVSMHREIMNPAHGGILVDHRNCNSLDNRKSNLRFATKSENMRNRRKKRNATSQYFGVFFYKPQGTWSCSILHNGKRVWLGRYKSEIEAARAYDEAAKKNLGEFVKLNFPPESEEEKALFTRIGKSWGRLMGALMRAALESREKPPQFVRSRSSGGGGEISVSRNILEVEIDKR